MQNILKQGSAWSRNKSEKLSSAIGMLDASIKETSHMTAANISSIMHKNVQHILEQGSTWPTNTSEKLSSAVGMHNESTKETSQVTGGQQQQQHCTKKNTAKTRAKEHDTYK